LDCATLGFDVAGGVFELAGGSAQRPDAALRDRAERRVLWAADDRERHARRVAVGLDRLLGVQFVEATVRPENAASRAVLAKVGFREEGLLRRYLQVDGGWRDHLLVGLTVEEVYGSVAAALVRDGHAGWA
jgi:hypothetical protein